MFDTVERASHPSPNNPSEMALDLQVHPIPALTYKDGLEPAAYPSITLWVGPPSKLQQLKKNGKHLQDEIRFVETEEDAFIVNPVAMPYGYLTKAETMNLVWGSLGKSIEECAKEQRLSTATARTHRANVYSKLGVCSISGAVSTAFDTGTFALVPNHKSPLLRISGRELEVLQSVSLEGSRAAAGEELGISENTVRTHLGAIISKNRLQNTGHAVMKAFLSRQLPLS